MEAGWLALFELLLVFGVVLAWAIREVWLLRADRRKNPPPP